MKRQHTCTLEFHVKLYSCILFTEISLILTSSSYPMFYNSFIHVFKNVNTYRTWFNKKIKGVGFVIKFGVQQRIENAHTSTLTWKQ